MKKIPGTTDIDITGPFRMILTRGWQYESQVNNRVLILHRSKHLIGTAQVSPYRLYPISESPGIPLTDPGLEVKTPHPVSLFKQPLHTSCADITQTASHQDSHCCTRTRSAPSMNTTHQVLTTSSTRPRQGLSPIPRPSHRQGMFAFYLYPGTSPRQPERSCRLPYCSHPEFPGLPWLLLRHQTRIQ